MSSSNFRSGFVGRDSQLSRIVQRVETLTQVLEIVRRAAPPELAPLCLGAAWHGSELLIALPHSAAATRLRMAAPAMIAALQAAGWHATAIRPKVQVTLQRQKPQPSAPLSMPETALNAFTELAKTVENDELRAAVEALLRHQRKR